ncbi:MAG: hypothetical protein R3A10_09955 [Caldilineaceae bacterium]
MPAWRRPTTGDIYFDNERITNLSARRRSTSAWSSNTRWPTRLDRAAQRKVPLIAEKLAKPERDRRIAEVAELLEMTGALDRDISTLDNGLRQKVRWPEP